MNGGIRKLHGLRRSVQLLALAFAILVPVVARYSNYLAARELDRDIEKWQRSVPGLALEAVDGVARALPEGEIERAGRMQRNRKQVLGYAQLVRGGPWSAEIGGVSLTDPLAAAESVAAARSVAFVLFAGAVLPLLFTMIFGRVFCSWICPMGLLTELSDRLRRLLRFLEIRPRDFRAARGVKFIVLAVGLLAAAVFRRPVLGYVYPPALIGRELHDYVFAFFDRAEIGRFGLSAAGLTWMTGLLAAIVLIEVAVSRRWWCRYVCPGGALYAAIGWARPMRVRLTADRCTGCAECNIACPMGLDPMHSRMGIDCDNCGACISSCGDGALAYGIEMPAARRRSRPVAHRSPTPPRLGEGLGLR